MQVQILRSVVFLLTSGPICAVIEFKSKMRRRGSKKFGGAGIQIYSCRFPPDAQHFNFAPKSLKMEDCQPKILYV